MRSRTRVISPERLEGLSWLRGLGAGILARARVLLKTSENASSLEAWGDHEVDTDADT